MQNLFFEYLYDWWDIFLFPLYLFLFIFCIRKFIEYKKDDIRYKTYFLLGFYVKIIMIFIYIITTEAYLGKYDTYTYYSAIVHTHNLFFERPDLIFEILFKSVDTYSDNLFTVLHSFFFDTSGATINVVKYGTLISLLSFKSYLVIMLFFCLYSYIGVWQLFLLFSNKYPNLDFFIFLICCCLPVVVFWTSGLLKETIAVGCLGSIIYVSFILLENENAKSNSFYIIWLLVNAFILYSIKSYILYSFIAAFGLVMLIRFLIATSNRNRILTILTLVFFLSISSEFIFNLIFKELIGESLIDGLKDKQDIWGTVNADTLARSAFSIGEIPSNINDLMLLIPSIIVLGVFRPFIWEANSPFVLFEALQTTFIFVLFAYGIYIRGFLTYFKTIFKDKLLFFSLLFFLFFSIGVGISTFNFGSMSRYRAPAVPFIILIFTILINPELMVKRIKTKFNEL
jgi:hypothetical protein